MRASLALAKENAVKTIAFPAISCGVYGYPLEQAVKIAVRECRAVKDNNTFERIIFCCFDAHMLDLYRTALSKAVD